MKDLKRELNVKDRDRDRLHVRLIQTNASSPAPDHEPWTPSPHTALKLLIMARMSAAIWSGISDCDETYNYWEPTHHLLYGQGLQTWEYDPRFALRSYFYLLIHVLPASLYTSIIQPNPMMVFYFLRCLLALVCSLCELYFYRGVLCEFGANVGRLSLFLMVSSAGMFISSTAFLPSSTSMYLTLLSMGAWFLHNYRLAIFSTALSTFVSKEPSNSKLSTKTPCFRLALRSTDRSANSCRYPDIQTAVPPVHHLVSPLHPDHPLPTAPL